MIKAYIDNEEVVFNKDFTIKEEMLNTSSIVLNNVFPVEWDNKKDYVSNFYFPKDYSKFRLYNENDISSFRIYGYCSQNGLPEPNKPISIETFTGEQDIEFEGKIYHLSLGDLELCGIGDFKDYIYYKNEKWWKYVNILKIHMKDVSYLATDFSTDTSIYFYGSSPGNFNTTNALSNRFRFAPYNFLTNTHLLLNGYLGIAPNQLNPQFRISNNIASSKAQMHDWLVNNETIAYVILNEPYEEEITDPVLLSQLNNISNKKTLFCGVVKNTGNISLNPRYPHYCSIEVLDFKTFLSEGETLDFVISGKTIRQAIEMVVDAIKDYGFVVGNIDLTNADEVIGAYNCQEKTAYDVFQYIKDITQSQWTTRMLDENTVAIDFYDPETMPRVENIKYTQEYFENNNIDDMKFSYSTDDYRNKQIMISKETYADTTYKETIIADGYTRVFATQGNIGIINSIQVDGQNASFTIKNDFELGKTTDFYYEPDKSEFYSNDKNPIYTVGTNIQIEYTPLVYGRQINQNIDEINRINASTGRKGVISRYETRNDALTSKELLAVGKSYLMYKGKPEITLIIANENKDLFNIGEVAYFEAPLDDLKQEYMVKSKEIRIIQTTGDVFYTYTLSSSFNAENAINYFDNQRNKNSGNISAGEFIIRNEDINANAYIIFNNLQVSKIENVSDNILNFALDGVLIK